ncbi:MAG: SEL1-like repeat protein [Bryobacteraceae bacterium]|jgi:TPR repeat protein
MYLKGQGVPEDHIQAYLWFQLAGIAGDADSARERDKVASRMTPGQIAGAQRLAQEWKPKPVR